MDAHQLANPHKSLPVSMLKSRVGECNVGRNLMAEVWWRGVPGASKLKEFDIMSKLWALIEKHPFWLWFCTSTSQVKSRYKLLVACEVQVISQSITKACSLSGCLGKIGLVGSPSSLVENCATSATSFGLKGSCLYFQSIFFTRTTIQNYKWLMQYISLWPVT